MSYTYSTTGYCWPQPQPVPTPQWNQAVPSQQPDHDDEELPPAKKSRYFSWESDNEDDEDEDQVFDPDTYYNSALEDSTAVGVKALMNKTFKKCLSSRRRKEISQSFPRPDLPVTKTPVTDPLIIDFMNRDFPKKVDEQLSKVQTSVIASCALVACLMSQLEQRGLTGEADELMPIKEVMKVCKASLMLVGNAVQFISQQRRTAIVRATPHSRSSLGKILKEVCKLDVDDEENTDLFGERVLAKVSERVNTLESFRKMVAKVTPSQKKQNRFLGRGPAGKHGDSMDPPRKARYTQYNQYSQQRQQNPRVYRPKPTQSVQNRSSQQKPPRK